ncbi:MAG: alpha/beta fold hydrolase [Deltaproteobacteria bacterium]|nr:alpha/beta fold hydrolase [Deltaproteobacteria bacterium]
MSSELRRRGALGLRFAFDPVIPGVRITEVLEGSAKFAGVRVGDVLLSGNACRFDNELMFRSWAGDLRSGEKVYLYVSRPSGSEGTGPLEVVTLVCDVRERERESSVAIMTLYTQATMRDGVRLRVIATTPVECAARGTILWLPGFHRASCDWAATPDYPMRRWVEDCTRAGYAVVRLERRGLGDSEGDPLGDPGLEQELTDWIDAAKTMAEEVYAPRPWVAFGYSIGGLLAPRLSEPLALDALGVYGSGIDTWTEYLDALTRRRMSIEGRSEVEIEQLVRAQQALSSLVIVGHHTVQQALESRDLLRDHARILRANPQTNTIDGRSAAYWQEVYQCPTTGPLASLRAPLLAMWGQSDWVTSSAEHERIAALAPKGRYVSVAQCDHGYATHHSMRESLMHHGAGPYQPAAASAFTRWIADTITRK